MVFRKIYKKKIAIPANVNIEKKQNNLLISGPLGSIEVDLKKLDPIGIGAIYISSNKSKESANFLKNDLSNKKYIVFCSSSKSFFGCISSIIINKIHGVTRGFLTYIRIIGVGYRAMLENQTLQLKLGFSHDIKFELPSSVRAFLLEPTLICLYGIDKNQVTQIAAKIRQIKPPSVYKGKGIRLTHENVFTKTGKRK